MCTLKGSTDQYFKFGAQSDSFNGVGLDSICPNFPFSQKPMSTKRADIHLI